MAKLVKVYRDDEPLNLTEGQMPLIVDENMTMIMDISGLGAICDNPLIRGKQLVEFTRKLSMLTKEEIKVSFQVACKDILAILSQVVPCVGCRRSVERLLSDLMKSGHPALDPLVVTTDGLVFIKEDFLKSPQLLCTMLHGHSDKLSNLVENQPRNRKSRRCVLHSLEIQRMRPSPNAWKEVWDCMELPCRQELALIENDTLDETVETYLRKHRFCTECRNKILLASSLLTRESEPTKEKGYVPILYSGIKRCIADCHVHLPTITDYIDALVGRAQSSEVVGRERHAKTLEMAQEEVLTCLGICVVSRLNRVHRRLKEEETVCKVLVAVAIDALSRNFQTEVEVKRGVSQLELLYEEFTREEIAKQQKREKLRLRRKKRRKERRYEIEEKKSTSDYSPERHNENNDSTYICAESNSITQDIDQHKLEILHSENKGLPTCKCSDCLITLEVSKLQNKTEMAFPGQNTANIQENIVKNNLSKVKTKFSITELKQNNSNKEKLLHTCNISKDFTEELENQCDYVDKYENSLQELMELCLIKPHKTYTMWFDTVINKCFKWSSSEKENHFFSKQYGQDPRYFLKYNINRPFLPSILEDSEPNFCDGIRNHQTDYCIKWPCDTRTHSNFSISLLKKTGGGLTLTQMLENSYLSDDEEKESYIPAEEVLEFKSRICQVTKKRQELRQTLRKRFATLCNHQKPFINIY